MAERSDRRRGKAVNKHVPPEAAAAIGTRRAFHVGPETRGSTPEAVYTTAARPLLRGSGMLFSDDDPGREGGVHIRLLGRVRLRGLRPTVCAVLRTINAEIRQPFDRNTVLLESTISPTILSPHHNVPQHQTEEQRCGLRISVACSVIDRLEYSSTPIRTWDPTRGVDLPAFYAAVEFVHIAWYCASVSRFRHAR